MAHYGTRVGVAELHRSNLDCPKIGGDPAGSPPGPLDSISRPVSRVLSARAKRPRLTVIPLRRRLPGALSNLPGRPDPDIDPEDRSARADASLAPSLFGLAPGGVCRAACVAARAVRSYRTVSPLPLRLPKRGSYERRSVLCGTFPGLNTRRTLSGTVRPWSPDFPLGPPFGLDPSDRPAD